MFPLMVEVCSTKVDEEGKAVYIVKNIVRLVLEAWCDVEPTEEQKEVDHINRDPFETTELKIFVGVQEVKISRIVH